MLVIALVVMVIFLFLRNVPASLKSGNFIDVSIEDADAHDVLEVIAKSALTGSIGDGKVFVLDLLSATRIRTGETGENAL